MICRKEVKNRIRGLEKWINQCEYMYSWEDSLFYQSDEIFVFREKAIHELEELKHELKVVDND